MNGKQMVQPIFILPEGAGKNPGKRAQKQNIAAAKAVADAIRTTLGPKGMDKMIVDSMGDIIVTNDGVTILDNMNIEHPAGKMLVAISKTQDTEIGDGTTTAAVLAGELLKEAEILLDQSVHPTIIAQGYRLAQVQAMKKLDEIANNISIDDTEILKNIAQTAMTGKNVEASKEYLADIALDAIDCVYDEKTKTIDLDAIKIEKKEGEATENSYLIKGILIDKERVHPRMPESVKDAKIALINTPLEIKSPETDAQIRITDPSQLQDFLDQEENTLKKMVDEIAEAGANVVFCQKGIDDIAQHYLAKKDILAIRRIKKSDIESLAKATGGMIVNTLSDLTSSELGYAKIVEERKISDEPMIFVEGCKDPKAVTLLIRGGTEHVTAEISRAMDDAIGGVSATIEKGKYVYGGGATEEAVAGDLRKYAQKIGGRQQLAINGFANALEVIPKTLAENAGADPIDVIVALRAEHDKGKKSIGVDVFGNKIGDMKEAGVIEALKIKTQAIISASEVAQLILRIDDVIVTGRAESQEPPQGMPPGMMPPGM
ncbi:MAG: TCP-1/cpn60 chaperonin family protein [Candidatus Aenigmarchaeota archaeon]|nr:TCP-1/cpn60 chaperonin family protein [Candidatus Aenigmarchaeota archaeon]